MVFEENITVRLKYPLYPFAGKTTDIVLRRGFVMRYDYPKSHRKVSEIEKEKAEEKALAERIGFHEGWSTCDTVVRNLRPTEEEKWRFIKRYGRKYVSYDVFRKGK